MPFSERLIFIILITANLWAAFQDDALIETDTAWLTVIIVWVGYCIVDAIKSKGSK